MKETQLVATNGPPMRIPAYDFARAIAIFGMVLVNLKFMMEANEGDSGFLMALTDHIEGRPSSIFVVLAGVGVSLMQRSLGSSSCSGLRSSINVVLLKRASFLLVAGLTLSLIWEADILHFFAIYFALSTLAVSSTNRVLWLLISVVFAVYWLHTSDWLGCSVQALTQEGELISWIPGAAIDDLLFTGFYPVFPWMMFQFLGIWIGRLDVYDALHQRVLLIAGASATAIAESAAHLASALISPDYLSSSGLNSIFPIFPWPPTVLYLISAGGGAVALIGLGMVITGRYSQSKWVQMVLATGRLSLTHYVAHLVSCYGLLYLTQRMSIQHSISCAASWALIYCLSALIFSQLWLRTHKRGPLESLMRWISEPRRPIPTEA